MKKYKHITTGEIMTVYPGQSVGPVLEGSPSWKLIEADQPAADDDQEVVQDLAADTKQPAAKKPAAKKPAARKPAAKK